MNHEAHEEHKRKMCGSFVLFVIFVVKSTYGV